MRQATVECHAGSGIKNGMRIARLIHKIKIWSKKKVQHEPRMGASPLSGKGSSTAGRNETGWGL